MKKTDIERVWEAFRDLQAQLDCVKDDVPVTRTEFAEQAERMANLDFRVGHLQKAVKEQYAAGIRTGLIAAAAFAGITVLTNRLLPK